MPLSEFDIIQRYFTRATSPRDDVVLGIGDDAALIVPPAGQQLAIAIDTLVEGVHFPVGTDAYDIGWKALAVNLSDLAAMGAEPAWFTLALSLEQSEPAWLEAFSRGLTDLARQAGIQLVGGDTTRGRLTVTIQIAGYVPPGEALERRGARPGDEIWVSGTPGDAAIGLLLARDQLHLPADEQGYLLRRLNRPEPRYALGWVLRGIATSCIDISDGLLADLGHLCDAAQVGAELEYACLPLSSSVRQAIARQPRLAELPLIGGDDYELCFTASPDSRTSLQALAGQLGCPLTCVGLITAETGIRCLDANAQPMSLATPGYQHFAGDSE